MMEGLFLAGAARQHARATEAQLQAQTASISVAEARRQNEALIADVDKLFMVAQALWEILKTEHGYTDELLANKVTEIDMRDGKLDGKAAKKERPACPSCGRKMGRHPVCVWCGTATIRDPFEL
jgi:ribosomal protein L32